MSNKSIGTIATMGIDIGKNSFRGAGGSLPPDSCRPMPMARTAELGQLRTSRSRLRQDCRKISGAPQIAVELLHCSDLSLAPMHKIACAIAH